MQREHQVIQELPIQPKQREGIMSAASSQIDNEQILEKLKAHAQKKLSGDHAKLILTFMQEFYRFAAPEDLAKREVLDLYGAAMSFWNFIYQREPGETKLRVTNPDYERSGWSCTHTVIELNMEDMPFIIDSVTMQLNRLGYPPYEIINVGGMRIKRNEQGNIIDVQAATKTGKKTKENREAVCFIEIDRQSDPEKRKELEEKLSHVLEEVRYAVKDWSQMTEKAAEALKRLDSNNGVIDDSEIQEAKDFVNWMCAEHFTFLGFREYEVVELSSQDGKGKSSDKLANKALQGSAETSLGLMRLDTTGKITRSFASLPEAVREEAFSENVLMMSKSSMLSDVHRPVHMDCVDVKLFNKKGQLTHVMRFLGLFTSSVYYFLDPAEIPFVRHKIQYVLEKSGLLAKSHAGKALMHIVRTLPRDDLFQASAQELLQLSLGILHLQERHRIRLFVRKDIYNRFVSCLVYVPREVYTLEYRLAATEILMEAFHGEEHTFSTWFSDSVLARIHFLIRIDPKVPMEYDLATIERHLVEQGRTWDDELRTNLVDAQGEEHGTNLFHRYHHAFPAAYRDQCLSRTAIYDITHLEEVCKTGRLSISFYQPLEEFIGTLRFKLFHPDEPIPLSDVLPILENMGFRILSERPYEITLNGDQRIWINDFGMQSNCKLPAEIEQVSVIVQDAFKHIWYGNAENDGFNRLVLMAMITWREAAAIRGYAKYLKQIGFTFSQSYIEQALAANPTIIKQIVQLFKLRFDPHIRKRTTAQMESLEKEILGSLDSVANLDQDRILRKFLELIKATLRTNFYQTTATGDPKDYISFKVDPKLIQDMPLPRPVFEIFVYSPRMEGVHLRGGKVARGGLRWSDRLEDFRTEVLGLVKAQNVKNALIVPSGAKGGFVAKRLPSSGSRDETMQEVVFCYQSFIRGLLDITDNNVDDEVVPPADTVRYDGDDPYLVVAADKGTATFSNIANQVSMDYGFWLSDAFASGGATGYDHKKMGITARGAWESVKRHFKDMGLNTQKQPFTVVGIGDLMGDVFGNGMLLSEHIQLVAAFNHLHIFIDPNPDTAKSFKERQRMFALPRSSWEDYDVKTISKGGGIFKRSAKSITLTPEMKQLLGVSEDSMVPNDLIKCILKANVDLMWNGGIGTFVKAESETHSAVGDRANDAIRVNANELRCKVIGEGGNLGFTQLSRIEFALNGGRVYTDFIDNSAGVDSSDHEVNLKILLNKVVAAGDMTEKQRNELLAEMTDEVAELVLRHNYEQTQILNVAYERAFLDRNLFERYYLRLCQQGLLVPEIEFLPDEKTLKERYVHGKSMVAPELSILLAYTKNLCNDQILASDLPDNPYFERMLSYGFPKIITERYSEAMHHHSLRREIISTQLANRMINDMGIIYIYRMMEETGAELPGIIRAYTIAKEVYEMPLRRQEIEALDYQIPSEAQHHLLILVMRVVRRAARWFLRNYRGSINIDDMITRFRDGMHEFRKIYPQVMTASMKQNLKKRNDMFLNDGVPKELAERVTATSVLLAGLDIIEISNQFNVPMKDVATVHFELGQHLGLDWFREQINDYRVENHWQGLARASYRDDLDWQHRELTISVIQQGEANITVSERIKSWNQKYQMLVKRWQSMLTNLHEMEVVDLVMLSVALKELLDLTQTTVSNRDAME